VGRPRKKTQCAVLRPPAGGLALAQTQHGAWELASPHTQPSKLLMNLSLHVIDDPAAYVVHHLFLRRDPRQDGLGRRTTSKVSDAAATTTKITSKLLGSCWLTCGSE
jgi:hypothetical protein